MFLFNFITIKEKLYKLYFFPSFHDLRIQVLDSMISCQTWMSVFNKINFMHFLIHRRLLFYKLYSVLKEGVIPSLKTSCGFSACYMEKIASVSLFSFGKYWNTFLYIKKLLTIQKFFFSGLFFLIYFFIHIFSGILDKNAKFI